MGMDVVGRKAATAVGEYFRASVWCWRPLHELLAKLCGDLLTEDVLSGMEMNEGAGPDNSEICKQISARLKDWLSSFDDDVYFLENLPQGDTPESLVSSLLQQFSGMELRGQGDYYIERERIEEFARFVESSGGFEVW